MDTAEIIDLIAENALKYSIVPSDWRVVPIGMNEDGRLMIVVDALVSDEIRDNLRFMFSAHVRELTVTPDLFDRLNAFFRSRFGAGGNGSGYHGEIDCDVTWKFKCPQDWAKMTPTAEDWVRRCGACRRNVVMCGNEQQIQAAKRVGACVAIARCDERGDEGDRSSVFSGLLIE